MIDPSVFTQQFQKVAHFVESIKEAKVQATGLIGEFAFNVIAKEYLSDDYKILSNIVLKLNNGTTQIDQILVSKFGVFVVEVKAYKGWIFGNEKDAIWTQSIYDNITNTFQNPLRQNKKHLNAVQTATRISKNKIKSLIVFSGECKFKTELPDNVVRGGEDYINYILQYNNVILSDSEVEKIFTTILNNRLSDADHQAYLDKLKEQYENADKNNSPQCPRCSAKMILRTAKKGSYTGKKFWGCSHYPKCRTIVNIEHG